MEVAAGRGDAPVGTVTGVTDAEALLALQAVDTRLDQLDRRRVTLPEREQLTAVMDRRGELAARRDEIASRRREHADAQRRLETEVAAIAARIELERRRASTSSAPRELQAIDAELSALTERRDAKEDQILELMEILEPIDAELAAAEGSLGALDAAVEGLRSQLATSEAELDEERTSIAAERPGAVAAVGDDVLRRYDDLRARRGGVVAGRLDGHRCTACMLQLPPMEVERLRDGPPGMVASCECGALLVVG